MTNTAPTTSGRAPGRDRNHLRPRRPRQIKVRYTHDEYAAIAGAARDAGLTPTGYVAETALAAANNTQVRRIGTNINQAARILNADGEQPAWLEHALAMTNRAVTHLDEAATAVTDVARNDRAARRTARGQHPRAAGQQDP